MKTKLIEQRCRPCRAGTPPLTPARIAQLQRQLVGWEAAKGELSKTYAFQDYHHTMAFVNAVAWIAHREDHHPDMQVGFNRCTVRFSTHSVGGLSENDFICAAKVDELLLE